MMEGERESQAPVGGAFVRVLAGARTSGGRRGRRRRPKRLRASRANQVGPPARPAARPPDRCGDKSAALRWARARNIRRPNEWRRPLARRSGASFVSGAPNGRHQSGPSRARARAANRALTCAPPIIGRPAGRCRCARPEVARLGGALIGPRRPRTAPARRARAGPFKLGRARRPIARPADIDDSWAAGAAGAAEAATNFARWRLVGDSRATRGRARAEWAGEIAPDRRTCEPNGR